MTTPTNPNHNPGAGASIPVPTVKLKTNGEGRPLTRFIKEIPCNNLASAFDVFVIQSVAEYSDGDGRTFFDAIDVELDEDEGEHLNSWFGIYGRYRDSVEVLNITDRDTLEAAEKFILELNGPRGFPEHWLRLCSCGESTCIQCGD